MAREIPAFHSRQRKWELIAALLWLPVHVLLLPMALGAFLGDGLDETGLNLIVYAAGAVFMLATQWHFLRRDFDPLCDHPGRVLIQICICYGAMLLFNLGVTGLLAVILGQDVMGNPNNNAVAGMAASAYGPTAALAIFLGPIVEEIIFRAAIFGGLRRKNRILAFAVSMLAFSVYHVWGYAISDPVTWVYVLQYLPVSYLLCRCYERTDSIWGSIFFHMLVNAVALRAMLFLQEML